MCDVQSIGAQEVDDLEDRVKYLKGRNKELQLRLDEQINCSEELRGLASKSLDLVKAGIGGNYGGSYYGDALDEFYYPLCRAVNATPAQSLNKLKADIVREAASDLYDYDIHSDHDAYHACINISKQLLKEGE